jgi:hypothetical protein
VSTNRDVDRIVRSWLNEDRHEDADRVLNTVLDELDTTPQRRTLWSAWRQPVMNNTVRIGLAAAAVVVIAVIAINLLPGSPAPGGEPTITLEPTTASAPTATPLPAGFYTGTPFAAGGFGMCPPPEVSSDCTEDPRDDTITFTYHASEAWEGNPGPGGGTSGVSLVAEGYEAPAGAAMLITRGNWLNSDPCRQDDSLPPDIPVGPTVDDFATALDSHPLLEVTTPVDVSLAGYSGKYAELQVPSDITGCVRYRPLEGTIYAQGPSHLWRLWILDVEGVRVVIQSADFPGTSAQHQAELQAIVDSIQIEP